MSTFWILNEKEAAIFKTHIWPKHILQWSTLQRKRYENQPSQQQQSYNNKRSNHHGEKKGIKSNGTFKKGGNIKFGSIIKRKTNNYRPGNISNYYEYWISITSDKKILGIVENILLLSFDKAQPSKGPFEFSRTKAETDVLEIEVEKLLEKGVISPTKIQPVDYFFNLFTRQKKYGTYRTILNVK